MKIELLDLLACPGCRSALVEDGGRALDIETATLECTHCHARYPVQNGMPLLYVADHRWETKNSEAEGWLAMSKEDGAYDSILDIDYSFLLPYYPSGTWTSVAPYFDAAVREMHLNGTETILDLGAGQGWACKYFALSGCRAVAIDILPDERIGLGRGRAIMDRAGVYFERLIGDSENLPFRSGTFDIVFCSSSLHHSVDMSLALKNVSRVLKPGGRFIALEPLIPITQREADAQRNIREVSYGIVESRANLLQLYRYLRNAGMESVSINNLSTLNVGDQGVFHWIETRMRECELTGSGFSRPLKAVARKVVLKLPRRYAIPSTLLAIGGDVIIQASKRSA